MGDSAGAGMVVSLLIIIREMGLPMPAGASLISPWVDLTHSMPSIGGWDGGDFIPNTGSAFSFLPFREPAELVDSITSRVLLGLHHLATASP
jgi:acetyl esterase/lipase